MKKTLLLGIAVIILALGFLSGFSRNTAGQIQITAEKSSTAALPHVHSLDNLKKLLKESSNRASGYEMQVMKEVADTAQAAGPLRAPSGTDAEYSSTNIQVLGVDEADVIKTDGSFIYQVSGQKVIITRVYPPESMQVVKVLTFNDAEVNPREIYVDDKYLVVIGSSNLLIKPMLREAQTEIYPPPFVTGTVQIIVYDISDKQNIKKIRQVEVEGEYVSSRKTGSQVYLVANKRLDYYHIMEGKYADPVFSDSVNNSVQRRKISLETIRYFPGCVSPNYIIVAGLDLDQSHREAHVTAYLGSGDNIYVSKENMYVAALYYEPMVEPLPVSPEIVPRAHDPATKIFKFALDSGSVDFLESGKVPGRVLNQFSMDEYGGFFRIATTSGSEWRTDEQTSKNNIYVMDADMNIVGKVEGIAPGERIYSARFMGDRAYMVTFKTVDPFFVIDMQNPRQPRILGALKIPGYSDYLHPYDANHIIGFGKETVELKQITWDGRENTSAYYQGMKVAVFDVSDVQNPVEKFKTVIGDRGTESEVLRNHKALLFSRERNLLAFPVTVREVDEGANPLAYGQFTFQGAYVYYLDLQTGFTLRGQITHLSNEDYLKSGYDWYGSGKNIERVIYIEDTLYTISKEMIKANNLQSLQEEASLRLY